MGIGTRGLITFGRIGLLLLLNGWPCSRRAFAADDGAALETGHPFVQNFAARDYHADSQTWAATQDGRGIVYIGNKGLVLEFDGVTWKKIPIGASTYVIKGLAYDEASRAVYVGALNELGFLQPTANGDTSFVSILDRLPAADRDFGSIYQIDATPDGVYFVAGKQVMRWRGGTFKVWKFPALDSRLQSLYAAGQLLIQHPQLGLQRLAGDTFVPASDDPFFRTVELSALAPGPDGSLVLGTLRDGLLLFDAAGKIRPLAPPLADFFKTRGVRHLLRLRDGSLIVATATAAVVVLGPDNRFQDRWDQAGGLQNEIALSFFEDRESAVWVCLYAGVSRVQPVSPVTIFDASNGLKRGSVHDLRRYHDTLYVVNDSGLYRVIKSDPAHALTARCERVPALDGDRWSLCATGHGLLVAGLGAVYCLGDDGQATLITQVAYSGSCLARSERNPDRVFLGLRTELRSLRFDPARNGWLDEGPVPGIHCEIHSLAETPSGDLWVGSFDRGVFRLRFTADGAGGERGAATVTGFLGQPGGALRDRMQVSVSASPRGELIACSTLGLSRFDEGAQAFAPFAEYGARLADGSFGVESLLFDKQGGAWVTGRPSDELWTDQQGGRAEAGGAGRAADDAWTPFPHRIYDKINVIDRLFADDDGVVWMAGTDGVVRLDSAAWARKRHDPPTGFSTLIRRASASGSEAPTAAKDGRAASPLILSDGLTLDAARNSVQFEVAANTFAAGADLRYRTRLEGFAGGAWTDWQPRTRVDYTNLPNGSYAFEAMARTADGVVGQPARVRFAVAPPWQRTDWAYALYAAAAAVAVAAFVRVRLERLRAANVQLEALVAERTDELRARQLELVDAKEAAEASDRAKSAFLANMSHELRTPLNAVLGYTQILLKDPEISTRNRERIVVVGQSGEHLLAMINEVLDLSKIEAGRLTVDAADFVLGDLLEEVAATFAPRMAEKGLRFFHDQSASLPRVVRTDASKLRQVLFNLIGNACKFTQSGEVRFTVSAGAGDDRWRFEVADTGMGIPENELRDIFLAFHQVRASGMSAQGTGLGLAISRRVVELLGGDLRVESEPGRGSRFWFELPLPAVAGSGLFVASERAELVARKITGFRGPPRRLLIADDEPVNRQVLREMLEPLGFQIDEAVDGVTAVARCEEQPPDGLLLDLRMMPMNGFEVARRLRAERSPAAGIGIIAISASVFESDREKAIEAGCDEFLPKPCKEEQLLSVLSRVLQLEWVVEEPSAGSNGVTAGPGDGLTERPPDGEIDLLLELARRGDIRGIKRRLEALRTTEGGERYAGFIRGLQPLVASYQMDRIRERLVRSKGG